MRTLWLGLLLLIPGCRVPTTGPVRLARGVPFVLRAPEAGPKFFASQEVVFHPPGGGAETLLTAVENDGKRLSIVASTPVGLTLFTVQVQGGAATVDARVPLPARLDPRLLPALVQLANWPLEDLRLGLEAGALLQDAGPVRTLSRKGRVVLTLTRDGQAPPFRSVAVAIPALGITLDIRTLEEAP